MELWTEVRRRVLTGEISRRKACTEYELHWQTLQKILGHVEPPGYRGGKAPFTVREWCRLGRVKAEKRRGGRGRSKEWIISHAELTRINRDGPDSGPSYHHLR